MNTTKTTNKARCATCGSRRDVAKLREVDVYGRGFPSVIVRVAHLCLARCDGSVMAQVRAGQRPSLTDGD